MVVVVPVVILLGLVLLARRRRGKSDYTSVGADSMMNAADETELDEGGTPASRFAGGIAAALESAETESGAPPVNGSSTGGDAVGHGRTVT